MGSLLRKATATTPLTTKVVTQATKEKLTGHRLLRICRENLWFLLAVYLVFFTITGLLLIFCRCYFKAKTPIKNNQVQKKANNEEQNDNKESPDGGQRNTKKGVQRTTIEMAKTQSEMPSSPSCFLTPAPTNGPSSISPSASFTSKNGPICENSLRLDNGAIRTVRSRSQSGTPFLAPFSSIPETSVNMAQTPFSNASPNTALSSVPGSTMSTLMPSVNKIIARRSNSRMSAASHLRGQSTASKLNNFASSAVSSEGPPDYIF